MTVRIIEEFGPLKRGEMHNFDPERAKFLIKNGYAVAAKETAINRKAHDALQDARNRDNSHQ